MIKYFKELLSTLKSIDQRLQRLQANSDKLASCVKHNSRNYGEARDYISTGHWNGGS